MAKTDDTLVRWSKRGLLASVVVLVLYMGGTAIYDATFGKVAGAKNQLWNPVADLVANLITPPNAPNKAYNCGGIAGRKNPRLWHKGSCGGGSVITTIGGDPAPGGAAPEQVKVRIRVAPTTAIDPTPSPNTVPAIDNRPDAGRRVIIRRSPQGSEISYPP